MAALADIPLNSLGVFTAALPHHHPSHIKRNNCFSFFSLSRHETALECCMDRRMKVRDEKERSHLAETIFLFIFIVSEDNGAPRGNLSIL